MLGDLRLYHSERILTLRMVSMWGLLTAALLFVSWARLPQPVWAGVIAYGGLVSFRLLDDLADLAHDREQHPTRCLVQTSHPHGFRRLTVGLLVGMACGLFAMFGPFTAALFMCLAGYLAIVGLLYAWGPKFRKLAVALALTKYPLMVLLIGSDALSPLTMAAAAIVYAVPFMDEAIGWRLVIFCIPFGCTDAASILLNYSS